MATIKNIIQTVFQSSGANNTNQDIDRVNRNMTRLGQSSASAGRSFAAQSQGLGGLVAAYAGAAATTFALQQAFDKLAQSARQTQTLEGLNTLAARSGESSTILLENVREITKNQLTLAESASQINLSLSAGFDSSQIEGLSQVALKASRALGRDLNDAYTRVVRGSAKMETELLDELGIYTKIDPATRAYAAAIGKTVGQLTEFERRQAFVNAVIEEGNRKYSSINTTLPTTAEKIEAFGTRILDIGGALGRFLADTVAPLAEFLTNNLTASLAAFGAIASLVAGKGVAVLREGLNSLTTSIIASGAVAEQSTRNFLGIGKATITASQNISNYSRELVGVTSAEKETFKALQETAKNRNLNNRELRFANSILLKNRSATNEVGLALQQERRQLQSNIITRENAIAVAKQTQRDAQQTVVTLRQQGVATQQLTDAINAERVARGAYGAAVRNNRAALIALRAEYAANQEAVRGNISTLRALNAAQADVVKASGLRGGFAGAISNAYNVAATSVGALGQAFTGLVSKALGLFSLVSIFTLMGSSIAEALGKGEEFDAFIRGFGDRLKGIFTDEDSKRIANTLQGITVGVLDELEKTNDELRNLDEFTFETKFLGFDVELTKTKADLVREVNSELSTVLEGGDTRAQLDSFGSLAGGAIGGAIGVALSSIIPIIGPAFGLAIGSAAGSFIGRALQDAVSGTELTVSEVGGQEALDRLKIQFSDAFEAVGSDLELALAKAFKNLEDSYGTAAVFDPIARQALNLQKQLLADSAEYINNVESISQLMNATGQSANVITETFNLEQGNLDAQEIANTLIELEGREFNLSFSFVGTLNEDIKSFLDSTTYDLSLNIELAKGTLSNFIDDENIGKLLSSTTIEGIEASLAGSGISYEQFLKGIGEQLRFTEAELKKFEQLLKDSEVNVATAINLDKPTNVEPLFNAANSAVNTFSQSSARAANNAADLVNRLKEGSIDIEAFDQRFKAVESSLSKGNLEFAEAEKSISNFRDAIQALPEGAIRNQGLDLVAAFEEGLFRSSENLQVNQDLLAVLKEQREELVAQAEVSSFIKDLTKDSKGLDTLGMQLGLFTAGLPDEAILSAQIAFLNGLVTASDSQIAAYDTLTSSLNKLNLTEADRLSILGAQKGQEQDLVNTLNARGNVEAKLLEGQIILKERTLEATGAITEQETAVRDLVTSSEEVTIALGEVGTSSVEATQQAVDAMETLIEGAIAELPKLIDSAINDFRKLSSELSAETESLRNIEIPKLKIEAEIDRRQFDFELNKLRSESAITRLELALDVSALKSELGDITPETDIDNQRRINQEILDRREELINIEAQNSANKFVEDLNLLSLENKQNIDAINARSEQLKSEADARVNYILSLTSAYQDILSGQESINNTNLQNTVNTYNAIAVGLYENLKSGGAAINAAIAQALDKDAAGGDIGPVSINAPELQTAEIDFTNAVTTLIDTRAELESTIDLNTAAQLEAESIRFENAVTKTKEQFQLEEQKYNESLGNLKTQREIEALNHRSRVKELNDEKKAGGKKAADGREKELKEAQKTLEKFYDDVEKGLKELQKLATDFVKIVFDAMINSKQLEVEASKVSESLATSILSNTANRLNSVQEELNEALNKELELKDELASLTEKMNDSQTSYLRAIAEGDLASASEEYIDSIVEQSRKTIELNRAMRDRSILEGAAQTLEQQQINVQEQVKIATQERMEAERELAELQQTTSGILELLSTDIFNFNDKLKDLAPALAALTGQIDGAFDNTGKPIKDLAKNIDGVVSSVEEAAKVIAKNTKAASKATAEAAKGVSTAASEGVEAAGTQVGSTFAATAVSALSSALQGAGIGQSIGQILGDETSASMIGGSLGAAIGSIIPGVGTVIGAIAGSLIGSLFGGPVKPAAYIRGNVTSEGYETYDIDRKDGLSKAAANTVESLVSQVYDSIFTSLERVNIDFKDEVDVFVRVTEGEFGRIRSTFKSGAVLTAKDLGSDPEVAAQELINEFLGGLTVERNEDGIITFRSLVVDALTPNASDVQQALDVFAELEDINKKTQEQFDKVVSFASGFKDSLVELNNAIPTLENSIALITSAAEAGAQNAIAANRQYMADVEEAFGAGDPRIEEARQAVVAFSLAQIGVMRAADDSLMSLKDYESGITAAGLAVNKTIKDFVAYGAVLIDAGESAKEAGEIISFALGEALISSVEDIADIIDSRLNLAREPSYGAVEDVIGNYLANQELLKEIDGQTAALLESADVSALLVPVEAFEENLNNVIEEAFSNPAIQTFIESLSAPIDAGSFSEALGPVIEAESDYLAKITDAAQKAERARIYIDPDEGYNYGPQIRKAAEEALEEAFSSEATLKAAREGAIAAQPALAEFFESAVKPFEEISYYSDLTNKNITLGLDTLPEAFSELTGLSGVSELADSYSSVTEAQNSLNDQLAFNEGLTNAAAEALEAYNKSSSLKDPALELAILEFTNGLEGLTSAQIEAVLASDDVTDATFRRIAEDRLLVQQQQETLELTARTNKAFSDFNNRMSDLVDGISAPNLKASFTALSDILNLLEETNASSFAFELSSAVNSIDASKNLVSGFTGTLSNLKERLNDGTITTEQYIDSLSLVIDTTLTAAESQKELADTYNEAIGRLQQFFDDALSSVQSAITNLRDEFIGLVTAIDEATSTIFDIYDETISDISSSGNELFDLRDSAREAFEASADAVKQFEEANSLSGKSAAQIASEISTIQDNIDSLLSSGALSFSEFRELSALTSEQNKLKRDLSVINSLEEEYNRLLADKTQASEDLAFIEQTIVGLGEDLVDSRSQESQAIQDAIAASKTFTRAQEDLADITQLLAENNFDLNQVRQDETDRVYQVTQALQDLERNMNNLETLVSDLLNSPEVREQIDSASQDLTAIITGNLDDAATTFDRSIAPIITKIQSALGSGNLDLGAIDEIEDSFDSLLATFTLESTNPVDQLTESFKSLNAALDGISATGINPITSTEESIQTLVSGIIELESAIDNITGGGGVDTLTQLFLDLIDKIRQAIEDVDVSTGVPIVSDIERQIQAAYQSVLGRNVDPAGLNFYKDILQNDRNFNITSELQRSAEKQFLQPAFQNLLGRMPSIEEVNRYKDQVSSISDAEALIRQDFDVGTPTTPGSSDADILAGIRTAFINVLERPPARGGSEYYLGTIKEDNGFDLSDMETHLRSSVEYAVLQKWKSVTGKTASEFPEADRKYIVRTAEANPNWNWERLIESKYGNGGTVLSDADILAGIRTAFVNVLERLPDSAGLNYYLGTIKEDNGFDLSNMETHLKDSVEYAVLQKWKSVTGRPASEFPESKRTHIVRTAERIPNWDWEGYIERHPFANGGYVTGPGTSTSDSIPAALSNGEFVMRASAVDKIGLGVLNMLNATGDASGILGSNLDLNTMNSDLLDRVQAPVTQTQESDTNIEVNVINNGTSQQPASEPVVRRENGKIIVDVILEDIRNNGPIKRTIRSIR